MLEKGCFCVVMEQPTCIVKMSVRHQSGSFTKVDTGCYCVAIINQLNSMLILPKGSLTNCRVYITAGRVRTPTKCDAIFFLNIINRRLAGGNFGVRPATCVFSDEVM